MNIVVPMDKRKRIYKFRQTEKGIPPEIYGRRSGFAFENGWVLMKVESCYFDPVPEGGLIPVFEFQNGKWVEVKNGE